MHIALLGAGFTRNWGGLLAGEVFNALIGHPNIRDNAFLRTALFDNRLAGGFENALAEIQRAYVQDTTEENRGRLLDLQQAVLSVFQGMNEAFLNRPSMEFQQHLARTVRVFLKRFDAIFSLNQDILLEHHYVRHLDLMPPWHGGQLPGMQRVHNAVPPLDPSWGRDTWMPLPIEQFSVQPGLQPLFKLHGSTNWKDSAGGDLLVIGGDKSANIASHAILNWSFQQFQQMLASGDARLMVIGYGFKDDHVNAPIINAVTHHGLRFFVIDALGADVARHANPSFGGAVYAPNALDDAFAQGLIGISQRPLTDTFNDDQVSHTAVMGFFE